MLGIPVGGEIPRDSVFARVEWPALKFNPTVTRILAVELDVGEDVDGTPRSDLMEIWKRCEGT